MYTIVGNDLPESSTESFLVSVSAGGLPVTLSPNTATVVIIDDDEGIYVYTCHIGNTIYI